MIEKGGITIIIRPEAKLITLCDGYIGYGSELKDYRWRFSHELKESDWKECTVELLEKYK